MFKIKKCAACNGNSFKLIVDQQVAVVCESCGQIYPQASIKRLPDDNEATRNIKLCVEPAIKTLIQING